MKNTLILNIPIYCLLVQYTRSQNNYPVYSGMQQQYHYPYHIPYPNQRIYKNYELNKWIQENYEDYNDYAEENCHCDKCDEIIAKSWCRDVCPNCFSAPVIAPSYVFLPFPYPYPVSPNTTLAPTLQTEEPTTASTTTSTKITIKEATHSIAKTDSIQTNFETEKTTTTDATILSNTLPEENNEVLKDQSPFNIKGKGQYMLTAVRRTKPHWLPKYGIVPISDKFAEKLMLQLRSMKVLHPQKDNMRNMDDITFE